ncbi:hypothetical protein CRG98_029188 [Punica granatum]|uniref:Uncharacterized protein n=1 Tax=Punica granatum TaxID=22663 RepID=A0A2I0J2G7_PUNGR|nr:hypothetical protein CRG98_029188 [Punica granatum]
MQSQLPSLLQEIARAWLPLFQQRLQLHWCNLTLRAKNKVGFIDGTLPKPADGDPNKPLWVMANSLVVTWIVNSLEKDLQPNITCIENAQILWEDLRQCFSQGKETRIYQLKNKIYGSRQEGKLVAEYYGSLKGLWDELDNLMESVTCSYACVCGAAQNRLGQREREKAYQFLMGLNPEFATDRESLKMIGVGELHGGVYHLRYIARAREVNKVATVRENDVWHKRLRHPSPRVSIPGLLLKTDVNKDCEDQFWGSSPSMALSSKTNGHYSALDLLYSKKRWPN